MKPLLLAIALIAPHSLHAEGSAVLGKIGDIELKTTELRETLAGLDPAQQAAIAKDPSALGPYVRAFLVRQMVLQKAVDEKYDKKPAVIARLVRAREAALAESYLESVSEPDPAYPSEAEIKRAYDDNKEKLVVPRSYRLAQIFISGGKESQARLDAVMKKLKAKDADFAAIARSASDEQASAAQGGEIGWLTEAQIQPDIMSKLPKLTLNLVSDPIQLDDGWHILKVLDIRETHTPTLSQVRDEFVTRMRAEAAAAKRQEFVAKLLQEHPLAINEIELNSMLEEATR